MSVCAAYKTVIKSERSMEIEGKLRHLVQTRIADDAGDMTWPHIEHVHELRSDKPLIHVRQDLRAIRQCCEMLIRAIMDDH